jgi:hypothetical protein
MTQPYSATYLTAFNYFKDAVLDEFGLVIDFGDNYELSFKNFYQFISKDVEEGIFLRNKSTLMIKNIESM